MSKTSFSRVGFFWMPVVLWAGVIYFFSSLPSTRASDFYWFDFVIKKTAHITEYGVFTILLYRAFKKTSNPSQAALKSILFAVVYALTDEFHQRFTPGRESTLRDVIFDTIGSTFSIWLIWNLLPKAPKKLRILAQNLQVI